MALLKFFSKSSLPSAKDIGIGEAAIKEANEAVSRVLAEKQPQQSSSVPADHKRKYTSFSKWHGVATPERSQHPQTSYGICRRSQACLQVVSMLLHIERTNPLSAWKMPPSMLWPTSVSWSWPSSFKAGGQEKRRQIGVEPASVTVCNVMFLCQHLGVAPEEGVYSWDKMSDPAYNTSDAFDKR